jgi:exonuclease-1
MRAGQRELGQKKMIDSIDVSPDIAYKLIQELKKHNYQYIVAPYEADAQLAYLSRTGLVDVIITEDSDLLAFGAKRILYKLDFTTLNGYEICLDQIKNYSSTGFSYFTHGMFLTTCVMAGCDYLPQIKGVGIKLAQKVISRNHTLKKSLIELAVNKTIPDNYEDNFLKALLTFRFQRVYCPKRKRCVEVNEL